MYQQKTPIEADRIEDASSVSEVSGLALNVDHRAQSEKIHQLKQRIDHASAVNRISRIQRMVDQNNGHVIQRYAAVSKDQANTVNQVNVASGLRIAADNSFVVEQTSAEGGDLYVNNFAFDNAKADLEEKTAFSIKKQGAAEKLPKADLSGPMTLSPVVLTKNNADVSRLPADCGRCAHTLAVQGDQSLRAIDETGGFTTSDDPYLMKYEVIISHIADEDKRSKAAAIFDKLKKTDAAIVAREGKKKGGKRKSKSLDGALNQLYGIQATLEAELAEFHDEKMEKVMGVNQYADPEVGEAYTMSTGGKIHDDHTDDTWNYHYATVLIKRDGDNITLENYATGNPDESNDAFTWQMYGTAIDAGQTFHEQHLATNQHGSDPTTLAVSHEPEEE